MAGVWMVGVAFALCAVGTMLECVWPKKGAAGIALLALVLGVAGFMHG